MLQRQIWAKRRNESLERDARKKEIQKEYTKFQQSLKSLLNERETTKAELVKQLRDEKVTIKGDGD